MGNLGKLYFIVVKDTEGKRKYELEADMKEMEFNFEEKDAQKFEDFFKALHKHYTDSKKFECGDIEVWQKDYFKFPLKLKNDRYSNPMGAMFNFNKSTTTGDMFISLRFYVEEIGNVGYICNNTDTIKNMAIISNTFMKAAKAVSDFVVDSEIFDFELLIKTFENDSIRIINKMFE